MDSYPAVNPAVVRQCRSCRKTLPGEASYCTKCGTLNPPDGKITCRKCNTSISMNDAFCGICGEPNPVGSASPGTTAWHGNYTKDPNTIPGLSYYYVNEFLLIKESRERYQGKWNWAAFFWSWIWAFTKGMSVLGWVGLLAALFLGAISYGFLGIVLSVYFGARGNYIYYKHLVKNEPSALF
jgi:ribosomal protein L40E